MIFNPHFTPYVANMGTMAALSPKRELVTYFGHYYMREPIAHSSKSLANAAKWFCEG
jgi:hypothetical protein